VTTDINQKKPESPDRAKEECVYRAYEEDEPEGSFYVEKSSRLIYEAKFFGEGVIVRPVTPGYEKAIQQLDMVEFTNYFEEYLGDIAALKNLLWGEAVEPLWTSKKD